MNITEMTLPREYMDPTWVCRVCFLPYPVLTQLYPLCDCSDCGSRLYRPGKGLRSGPNRARSNDPKDS